MAGGVGVATPTPARAVPLRAVALAAAVIVFSAVVLCTPLATTTFGLYFDDLGELVAAAVAAGVALWRSRRASQPQLRRTWF